MGNDSLTLLGRGGAESARTFFKRPFLHEKSGLEVPNFVTFSNSHTHATSRSPALLGLTYGLQTFSEGSLENLIFFVKVNY